MSSSDMSGMVASTILSAPFFILDLDNLKFFQNILEFIILKIREFSEKIAGL